MYAFGRGCEQNFDLARPLLESAANANHAPSVYYIGVFKTRGYSYEINYDQAINWFEKAAGLEDERIREKAYNSAYELKKLVEEANKKNEEIINRYQSIQDL